MDSSYKVCRNGSDYWSTSTGSRGKKRKSSPQRNEYDGVKRKKVKRRKKHRKEKKGKESEKNKHKQITVNAKEKECGISESISEPHGVIKIEEELCDETNHNLSLECFGQEKTISSSYNLHDIANRKKKKKVKRKKKHKVSVKNHGEEKKKARSCTTMKDCTIIEHISDTEVVVKIGKDSSDNEQETFIEEKNIDTLKNKLTEEEHDEMVYSILAKYGKMPVHGDHKRMLRELKSKGLSLSRGNWKECEIEQLKLNWDVYKNAHPQVKDPEKLLSQFMFPDEQRALKKIGRETCLYESLGYRIKRPYEQCYKKGQNIFLNWKRGAFSQDELETLSRMQESGVRWKDIACHTDRLPLNIAAKGRSLLMSDRKRGHWSKAEHKRLKKAMSQFKEYDDICEDYKYKWQEISILMKTRTAMQCVKHYYRTIMWNLQRDAEHRPRFSIHDRIKLIEDIIEDGATTESEIDWAKLASNCYCAPNSAYLVDKWHRLVHARVPQYHMKSLDEITDYLAQFELPRLQGKLERKLKKVSEQHSERISTVADDNVPVIEIKTEKQDPKTG